MAYSNTIIRRLGIALVLIVVFLEEPSAQIDTVWVRCFGGADTDLPLDLQNTPDGEYVATGYTRNPADQSDLDVMIVKIRSDGSLLWKKQYGGSKSEIGYSAAIDQNGDIFVYARSFSSDKDVQNSIGGSDNWILHLDPQGNLLHQKSYGSAEDDGFEVSADPIISYRETGRIKITEANTIMWVGIYKDNVWVVETDKNFSQIIYNNITGGSLRTTGSTRDFVILSPNSYIVTTCSIKHDPNGDFWVFKREKDNPSAGFDLIYERKPCGQEPRRIIPVADNGFYIIGIDHDCEDTLSPYNYDIWMLRLDSNGQEIKASSRIFSGNKTDQIYDIKPMSDGGFLVAGSTVSDRGVCKAFENYSGQHTGYLIRTDKDGNILWQTNIGGNIGDAIFSIYVENDETFVLAGYGGKSGPQGCAQYQGGEGDFWMAKFHYTCNIKQPVVSGEAIVSPDITTTLFVIDSLSLPNGRYHWQTPLGDTITQYAFLSIHNANQSLHQGSYKVTTEYYCCFSSPSPPFELVIANSENNSQSCGNWILTPNGDGQNDTFEPYCLIGKESALKIFNLWGKCVYESDPYNNDWGGTSGGQLLPEGAYLYDAITKYDENTYRGTINLRK